MTAAKNEGLPGVTVLVEGTSVGGSTNADGTYPSVCGPAEPHTLAIFFIGFPTARVPVPAGQTATVPARFLNEQQDEAAEYAPRPAARRES